LGYFCHLPARLRRPKIISPEISVACRRKGLCFPRIAPQHRFAMAIYQRGELNMRDKTVAYRGVTIAPQPTKLRDGGWMADFTLFEENGSTTDSTSYLGTNVYATREEAELAAFNSAREIIDGRDPSDR
jgi:hypothetical protein